MPPIPSISVTNKVLCAKLKALTETDTLGVTGVIVQRHRSSGIARSGTVLASALSALTDLEFGQAFKAKVQGCEHKIDTLPGLAFSKYPR